MDQTKNKKAFTLVELIITISVLIVLGTLGTLSYKGYTKDARDFKRVSDISLLKSATLVFKKTNGKLPDFVVTSSGGLIYSGSTANSYARQGNIEPSFLANLGISQKVKDPTTNSYYMYGLSTDKQSFQYATTLETDYTLSYNPLIEKTYAGNDCGEVKSYVEGNFIPSNLNTLPGLLYAFDYVNENLDISLNANLKKVILNDQKINIAYDYTTNKPKICSGDVFSATVGTSTGGLSLNGASCINSVGQTIQNGTNEVFEMSGTTLNSQIGWKYKVCNNGVMDKNGVGATSASDYYYVCKDIGLGAIFDTTCKWTGCFTGYTPKASGVGCVADVSTVTLASPQNGAYSMPLAGNLAWYHVKDIASGNYKVYLGTTNSNFDIINGISTIDNFMQFNSLQSGKMYFWKVQFCDSLGRCKDSSTYSFSTATDGSSSSNSSGSTTTPGVVSYCPPGITCRVDDVNISYLGCSPGSSSYSDCKKDDFGTSEKNGADYFGVTKSIGYKITNNSDGIAKFNILIGKTTLALNGSSSSFDDTTAVNVNGNTIGNNFYWNAGDGCLGNAVTGYSVSGRSSCYITFYYRGDPLIATTSALIQNVKIANADTSNGSWADTTIPLVGKTTGYNQSQLTYSMYTTKYKSTSEPTSVTTAVNDFDTSTLDVTNKGYWKALVYVITNPNAADSYFKPMFTNDYGTYSIAPVNSSVGTDADFSQPQKNIDIGLNGIGNLYYNNGDYTLSSPCITYKNGLKLLANTSCKITIFFRADQAVPGTTDNLFDMTLSFQPVANQASLTKKTLYGKKNGGNTTLFTNFFPYSYNGWWTDMSTFQINGDLTPTGFVRSQTMGWIDMSGTESGSTIKIYFDNEKRRIKGKTYGETAGWVDFNKLNDPNTQTYIDGSGSLHGWARSQNYGWVSFDNGVQQ